MGDEDLCRFVGVVGANAIRCVEPSHRVERCSGKADRHLLPGGVAVRISDIRTDVDNIIAARLCAEPQHKSVIPLTEVGVDQLRREGWFHLDVIHHGIGIDRGVEADLKGGVGIRTTLTVSGIGPDDPR